MRMWFLLAEEGRDLFDSYGFGRERNPVMAGYIERRIGEAVLCNTD
jgi:hypothetical protein